MNASLTEATARERINTYLLEALQALPPGAALSHQPDNPGLGAFGDEAAITVPCEDSDVHTGGPEQVQIRYWVVGIPAGRNAHYFEVVRDTWIGRGYRLESDVNSAWAPVRTPDGYGLVVRYVSAKEQSLSITAGSPCFPRANLGTTTPQPAELHRPF
ncbi:hypothetical protein [Nocardia sp. NPDC051570]|uniref:hypothetical protein n=1 Tax=Nocardia sp. NPDC051570 TaxID=3364324 RepID=UPI0037B63389